MRRKEDRMMREEGKRKWEERRGEEKGSWPHGQTRKEKKERKEKESGKSGRGGGNEDI